MSRCGECGASVRPNTTFCTSCGAAHSKADELGFVCPECHQFNEAGAQTCRSCGSSLVPSGFTGFLRAANIDGTAKSNTEGKAGGGSDFSEPSQSETAATADPATESTGGVSVASLPAGRSESVVSAQSSSRAVESDGAASGGPASTLPGKGEGPPAASAEREAGGVPSASAAPPGSRPPTGTQAMPIVRPPPGPGTLAFGPLRPGRAKLLVVRGRCFQGSELRLNAPEVAAGRSAGLVVFPDDPLLADLHATFVYKDERLCLRDEGGPGGSWLRIREPVALRANAELAVGDTRLAIRELAEPPARAFRTYGSPRVEGSFRMEEQLEGDRPGRAWMCSGEVVTIGSSGASVTILGDPLVARRHAEIRRVGPRWVLADCGGPEGTFVRVAPGILVPLRNGDRVRIGSEILEIRVAA